MVGARVGMNVCSVLPRTDKPVLGSIRCTQLWLVLHPNKMLDNVVASGESVPVPKQGLSAQC